MFVFVSMNSNKKKKIVEQFLLNEHRLVLLLLLLPLLRVQIASRFAKEIHSIVTNLLGKLSLLYIYSNENNYLHFVFSMRKLTLMCFYHFIFISILDNHFVEAAKDILAASKMSQLMDSIDNWLKIMHALFCIFIFSERSRITVSIVFLLKKINYRKLTNFSAFSWINFIVHCIKSRALCICIFSRMKSIDGNKLCLFSYNWKHFEWFLSSKAMFFSLKTQMFTFARLFL